MAANGTCPRCGVAHRAERAREVLADPKKARNPHADRLGWDSLKESEVWGTIFDRETGQWHCVECGCVWTGEPLVAQSLLDTSVCPVCGGMTTEVKCKVVCDSCCHIIENCSGS